jgi:hypothetical protein
MRALKNNKQIRINPTAASDASGSSPEGHSNDYGVIPEYIRDAPAKAEDRLGKDSASNPVK